MKHVMFPENGGAGPRSFGIAFTGEAPDAGLHDNDVLLCDPDAEPRNGDLVLVVRTDEAPYFARLWADMLFWPMQRPSVEWVELEHIVTGQRYRLNPDHLRGLCKVMGHAIPVD